MCSCLNNMGEGILGKVEEVNGCVMLKTQFANSILFSWGKPAPSELFCEF